MDTVILTSSANTGIGLWTSICVAFASIMGCESKNYKRKQKRILKKANEELYKQLAELGPGYELFDYRVVETGKLAITVSAIAKNPNKEQSFAKAKAKEVVDEELPSQEVVKNDAYYEQLTDRAKKVFNNGNYEKGYKMLLEASEKNNRAKYYLAKFCYAKGWGTKKNIEEAKRILTELAEQGDEKAIEALKEI